MRRTYPILIGAYLCSLFSVQSLDAYIDACYEWDHRYDCTWSVGGELLVWRPCVGKPCGIYTVPSGASGDTTLENPYNYGDLGCGYDYGFRVFLAKDLDCYCSSFYLDWVHIHFNNSIDSTTYEEGLDANARVSLDRVNLRAFRDLTSCDTMKLEGFVGASFLRLKQKRVNGYEFILNNLVQIGDFTDSTTLNAGVGELGLRGKVDLCYPCFYLSGEVGVLSGIGCKDISLEGCYSERPPLAEEEGAGAGAGEGGSIWDRITGSNQNIGANGDVNFVTPGYNPTDCFTGFEYRLEIGFIKEWCGVDWKLYAGYEGLYLHDLSAYFVPQQDGSFKLTSNGLGFAGPFVGVSTYMPF